jgi:hypothetical protein
MKPKTICNNKHEMEFDNGSKIQAMAMTEYMVRGRSCSLVLLDELAFVKKSLQDELWTSLCPTICNDGRLVVASTPNVHENGKFFEDLWRGAITGKNGFHPIYASGLAVPGYDQVWQEKLTRTIGEEKFKQEYLVEFLS